MMMTKHYRYLYARQLVSVLVILTLMASTGCQKKVHVTNLPQGVSEGEVKTWLTAVGAVKRIGELDKQATQALVSLHNIQRNDKPLIPGDKYAATLRFFGRLSQAGINADNILHKTPEYFGKDVQTQIKGATDDIFAELQQQDMVSMTGVSSPEIKNLQALVGELQGTAKILVSLFTP